MPSIDIFYQGEHIREVEHIEVDNGHTIAMIKALICAKHGGDAAILLFLEDGDEPIDEVVIIGQITRTSECKLHLHRCHHVEVSVAFAGETVRHSFRPSATIARIKTWVAVHKFGMTEEEAAEYRLQISGTHDRPTPGTHVGTLTACPNCKIAFDLVPDERVNGATVGGNTVS
jgi:hypothetical protein